MSIVGTFLGHVADDEAPLSLLPDDQLSGGFERFGLPSSALATHPREIPPERRFPYCPQPKDAP